MKTYNEAKFAELLLYVAGKCEGQRFRTVKLDRILFSADFLAYKTLGQSITGAEYVALEHGPAAKCLASVRERLEAERALATDRREHPHRPIALRTPDLSLFTAAEIALVDRVIETLQRSNGDTPDEQSPGFLGWKAARAEAEATGEPVVIPYGTVFVSNEPLDEFEQALGLELAKKHGWAI